MNQDDAIGAMQRLMAGDLSAVIFEGGPFFVQFAEGGDGRLLAEAVGDEYLEERLAPGQLRLLHDLGFRPPPQGKAGNLAMSIAASAEGAVALALTTLGTAYGVGVRDVVVTEV